MVIPINSQSFPESQIKASAGVSPSSEVSSESSEVGEQEGMAPISFPSLVVNYAFDTLHINYQVVYEDSAIFPKLKELKGIIQGGMESEKPVDFFRSGLFTWNLQRTGNKFFPYLLKTGDLTLGFSTRSHESTIPNMCLMVGSLSCNQDLDSLLKQFKNWLKLLKVKIVIEKVSRFDLCADIRYCIRKSRTDKITRFITKATKTKLNHEHRKFTGIQIGTGDIVGRIYDKQVEMKGKGHHEKQVFFNTLWKTTVNDSVTRVEFQARRKAVVEMLGDITTVKVLFEKKNEIWAYFTKTWLRHSQGFVDRDNKNQKRAKLSEFWKQVQSAIAAVIPPIDRNRKQKHINIPALMRQVRGIMLSVSAGVGHHYSDQKGILNTIMDSIHTEICEFFPDPSFKHAFEAKQTRARVSF